MKGQASNSSAEFLICLLGRDALAPSDTLITRPFSHNLIDGNR